MYSFVCAHTRTQLIAQTFEWFTYSGTRPLEVNGSVLCKGQRFGVKQTADGQDIEFMTVGAAPKIIDLTVAKRLARNVQPEV